jgi:hypothetical protein
MEQSKKQEVIQKIKKEMDKFFDSIPSPTVQALLLDNSFTAGGAIASLIREEKPNDIDIYMRNPVECLKVANYFLAQMGCDDYDAIIKDGGVHIRVPHGIFQKEKEDGKKFQPLVVTANAISFSDGVQFVTRFCGEPNEIASNFDFLHTKGIYDYSKEELIVSDETEKAILDHVVTYTGSIYPLASMIRLRKFMKRGWKVNAGQFLKISIQISQLDLSDPLVLKEQLVGVDLLHFTEFLHQMEKNSLSDLSLDSKFDKLFELIDKAFEQNEEQGLTEEEFSFLA